MTFRGRHVPHPRLSSMSMPTPRAWPPFPLHSDQPAGSELRHMVMTLAVEGACTRPSLAG